MLIKLKGVPFVEKKFNLSGLRLVGLSLVIDLIAGFVGGGILGANAKTLQRISETNAAPSGMILIVLIALLAVAIVTLVMFIKGLSMASGVSKYYKRARSRMIWALVLTIIGAIITSIGGVVMQSQTEKAGIEAAVSTPMLVLILIGYVITLVGSLIALAVYKNILYGNADVATRAGDPDYAKKNKSLWKRFLVVFIITIIFAILCGLFVGMFFVQMVESGALTDLDQLPQVTGEMPAGAQMPLIGMMICGIVLLVLLIIIFIQEIKMIARIFGTVKRFHSADASDDGDDILPQGFEPADLPSAPAEPAIPETPKKDELDDIIKDTKETIENSVTPEPKTEWTDETAQKLEEAVKEAEETIKDVKDDIE